MKDKNLDGRLVSKMLLGELKEFLKNKQINPMIVDISVGNDFGGEMYAKMKEKRIKNETGIEFYSQHFNDISFDELINYIKLLNENNNVTGIMLQLPLPSHLSKYTRVILDTIDPSKDVDGLTTFNMGKLVMNDNSFIPCTALGIQVLLRSYNINLRGMKVAIVNRSNIVGKPLLHLLVNDDAVVYMCHSKVNDLRELTRNADIVVAAMNKMQLIDSSYIKDGAIVLDVGVHKNENGKTVGDVNYNDVYDKVSYITPPVGGVGPMTVAMLAYNSAKSVYFNEVDSVLNNGIENVKKLVLK